MIRSGAQIILDVLKEEGCRILFGYPGGAVIPLYDALYDERDAFIHIRTSHEQGALHAADGYARATGKTGVAFVTSGPGATNAVTGIATAYMDSVPMVIISGQVPTSLLGRDSFQEVDITGITFPITKHNFLVKDLDKLAETVREAFRIAEEGRPGPVLVDVPKDLFIRQTEFVSMPRNRQKKEMPFAGSESIHAVANRINQSKRPVIYAGGGVAIAGAESDLRRFAEKAHIPVVNTLMGLGSYPRKAANSLGLVGMHGSREANLAITHADLVIAVGARFSDRVISQVDKFAPDADIIHIDIDHSEIGKNKNTHISLLGEMNWILKQLIEAVLPLNRRTWHETIQSFRYAPPEDQNRMIPENIFRLLSERAGEQAVVATDVGQHQMWTAQFWPFQESRQFITSGGLGTMGFGLGASLGAQLGRPDAPVILVTGDGSFRMNAMEMAALAEHQIPVLILLMNNHALGMVRQWQKMFQGGRYSETCVRQTIDHIQLAKAFGIEGVQARTIEELERALQHPALFKRPFMLEVVIDRDLNVLPIVPPGMAINDLILE